MKKITALLLALVLAFSLCTMVAATDETVTIVLEPADDTLLTAEGLALFFVDRAAIDEEVAVDGHERIGRVYRNGTGNSERSVRDDEVIDCHRAGEVELSLAGESDVARASDGGGGGDTALLALDDIVAVAEFDASVEDGIGKDVFARPVDDHFFVVRAVVDSGFHRVALDDRRFIGGKEVYATDGMTEGLRMAPAWIDHPVKKGYNYMLVKLARPGYVTKQYPQFWGAKLEVFSKE